MKTIIKKAQTGATTKKKTVPMSVAKKKVDSLDYDARTRKQAAMNRTVGPKGYDDISQKLIEQSNKSDSLKKVWQKNIDKSKLKTNSSKKSKPAMKSGGKIKK
jgi:hypothetical protein